MKQCFLLLLINCFYLSDVLAQEQLVKNINPYPDAFAGAECNNFTPFNGKVIFTALDKDHGDELWITDGTTAGTSMIKDIYPGSVGSYPYPLVKGITRIYFAANNDSTGNEIWRTDGTADGTQLIKDILPGNGYTGYSPYSLITIGDTLYFVYDGTDLYRTDGTESGTVLIKQFSDPLNVNEIAAANGIIFFPATDNDGTELWKSDGTSSGTIRLKDIEPGIGSSAPGNFAVVGSTVYFAAYTTSKGYELWKSDGTGSGTVLVKDIYSGDGSSSPQQLFDGGGTLYFEADDGTHGMELWKSDGTATGTKMVKDLETGSGSSSVEEFQMFHDTLFFVAVTSDYGDEVWKSDGTPSGTSILKDIFPGANPSYANSLTVINDSLYFWAYDEEGNELWVTDGTSSGTHIFDEVGNPPYSYGQGQFGVVGGDTAVTYATDGYHGLELFGFVTGSDSIQLVKDINTTEGTSYLENFLSYNDRLFFRGYNTVDGLGVYSSDGTDTGTYRLKSVYDYNLVGTDYSSLMPYNGYVYFTAYDSTGKLWRTDGTPSGTTMVTNGTNLLYAIYPPDYSPTVANNYLFFAGWTTTFSNTELWRTDGTNAGTIAVTNNYPYSTSPYSFAVLHDQLYFFTQSFSGLWKSDGSVSGTNQVKVFFYPYYGAYLVNMNDTLYFMTGDNLHGNELWKSDGTQEGSVLLKDIRPGTAASDPAGITVANCALYFSADDGTAGNELWTSDGTTNGTVLVKDINPGAASSNPSDFLLSGSIIFFWADDGVQGRALWETDGTANGTVLVKDVYPGSSQDYYPRTMYDVNGLCYFVFADSINGPMRMYRSDGTESGTYAITSDSFTLVGWYDAPFMNVNGTMYVSGVEANDSIEAELYKVVNPDAVNSSVVNSCLFCSGDALTVPFSFISAADPGNVYTAELSDATGDFANGTAIGSITSSLASGSIACTIPVNTSDGSSYKIRVSRSTPSDVSEPVAHDFTIKMQQTWYQDLDQDGYGNVGVALGTCAAPPSGYVADSTDCDDNDYDINPGQPDIIDGIDNNCNGILDDSLAVGVVFSASGASLNVYPNPAVNAIHISYRLPEDCTDLFLELSDLFDHSLLSVTLTERDGAIQLSTTPIAAGSYYVKLYANNRLQTIRKISIVK